MDFVIVNIFFKERNIWCHLTLLKSILTRQAEWMIMLIYKDADRFMFYSVIYIFTSSIPVLSTSSIVATVSEQASPLNQVLFSALLTDTLTGTCKYTFNSPFLFHPLHKNN